MIVTVLIQELVTYKNNEKHKKKYLNLTVHTYILNHKNNLRKINLISS